MALLHVFVAISLVVLVHPGQTFTPARLLKGAGPEDAASIAEHGARFKRVVGGRNAKRNEIPHQVLIYNTKTGESCGGSIIDPFYVLTARHCVPKERFTDVEVVASIVCTSERLGVVRRKVSKVFFPKINKTDSKNSSDHDQGDIALLKMNFAFAKDYYGVSAIPLRRDIGYEGKNCYVSGWGATKENGTSVKHLQVADVELYSRSVCNKVYKYRLPTDVTCAGSMEGGKDSCQGDSGGPLVCGGLLTGVVKNGMPECGAKYYPGKYTEVARHISWIASTIGKPVDRIGFW